MERDVNHQINYKTPLRSRRNFLNLMVSSGATALLLACDPDVIYPPNPETNASKQPETPQVCEPPTEMSKTQEFEGALPSIDGKIILELSDDNIPLKYSFDNQCWFSLDTETMKAARNNAISKEEPVLATVIRNPEKPTPQLPSDFPQFSDEHQVLKTLPDDTLSEDELDKKGLKIIQSDRTRLFIRKGAFEEGGPLKVLGQTDSKLLIVLVDGPVVTRNELTDPKYKEVRGLLNAQFESVARFRRDRAQSSRRIEMLTRDDLNKSKTNIPTKYERKIYEGALLSEQINTFFYENMASDEELQLEMNASIYKEAGLYFQRSNIPNTSVVFVACGTTPSEPLISAIFFDARGNCQVRQEKRKLGYGSSSGGKLSPKPRQSFPNPQDYDVNPEARVDNPKSYPFGAQSAGFTLRHELAHNELIRLRGNFSEYDTDMNAMSGIARASNRWTESRFKDNSDYYFLFSLPQDSRIKGYIMTSNLAHAYSQNPNS